ncbi:transcription termination/antitermination protein NusG [Brevibacterium samyangense]|uniref:Transcription termination/antitermination protein NusG n=1 Tax=Brevibacterium samyangense TaxID=366888 RepID=A0ABN2TI29_9MICO
MSENTPENENVEETEVLSAETTEAETLEGQPVAEDQVPAVDGAADDASAEAPVAESEVVADEAAEVEGEAVEAADDADADEDAVDPAVEEFKSELRSQVGDWYVIHSYAGYENRVKTNLENRAVSLDMEDYIFEVQVPMEDVVEIKNGQRKTVRRVRIPGYVLVRMDLTDESWGVVRNTPGITGFVGNAYDPVPLTIDEVFSMLAPVFEEKQAEALRATDEAEASRRAAGRPVVVEFEVGESVMVKEGSFEGHPATVQEINPTTQKLTVLLSIFERDVPVELGFDQVAKI